MLTKAIEGIFGCPNYNMLFVKCDDFVAHLDGVWGIYNLLLSIFAQIR